VELGLQDSILFNAATVSSGPLGFLPIPGKAVGSQGITSLGMSRGNGFSFSASNESVNIFVRALETQGKTQVLSRPRLVTLHNRRASIDVGQEIYYPGAVSSNQGGIAQSPEALSVGTALDIIPRIMPDGMIAMGIYVRRSGVAGWRDIVLVNGTSSMPDLNTATTATTINAMDGETVIFSGLITEEKISSNTSVPLLNKIPVLKHLVEYDKKDCRRSELLIAMTPRIIRTPEDMVVQNRQEQERMSWCIRDVVKMTGDRSIQRRSDQWYSDEVRHTYGTPMQLNESQLPSESKMPPMPMPPPPTLPTIETK
jgi:general secretion pathway protein D